MRIATPRAAVDRDGPPALADRSRWHVRANAPVAGWLLAVLVVALAHRQLPVARWLLVHLLLLGAVTNAILVWSTHFADALLRRRADARSRRWLVCRLVALNAGVATVVAGMTTSTWPVTLAGGVLVAAAVGGHGVTLAGQLRGALGSRFAATVRYYVAAALLLPVGAGLGVLMAHGVADGTQEHLVVAHVAVNVLGFVGLTVLGTLVTLWPTMLRTRIVEGAERAAARGLWLLLAGVALTAVGAVAGQRLAAAAGVLCYLGGAAVLALPLVRSARRKPPAAFATWSVLAGLVWLGSSLVTLAVVLLVTPTWSLIGARFGQLSAPLAAGFAAQVLLGALSYLVPVVLGGGPFVVRATTATLERAGALRVTLLNAALLVCVLPAPSLVRVLASVLALAALAAFLPLLSGAVWTARRLKAAGSAPGGAAALAATRRHVADQPQSVRDAAPARGRHTGMVAAALAAVVLAVAGGVALDPGALGTGAAAAAAGVRPTGHTTTVRVSAHDMRFFPASVDVPAGNRLVIDVTNTDTHQVHDLTLETGQSTGRLAPGASGRVDAGVVGRDLDGWCSVVGHRQMGMVFAVRALGAAKAVGARGTDPSAHPAGPGAPGAAGDIDLMRKPPAQFRAHDARLAPAPDVRTHHVTLRVRDVERDVAVGVRQRLWTYDGTAPGPTLRGRVGDRFVVTLVNDADMGHGIDFHAGSLAPDAPMRTIAPGHSLVYRFTATHSGIWLYHCSTMPMSAHIANGMFGAVIIDPPDLPPVEREYVLVQSELYLGRQGGSVDTAKVAADRPDLVVFNGFADQYDHRPLTARVGQRVRIWVLAAGPNRGTDFHVVGGQFDTVYKEGGWLLRPGPGVTGGSQVLDLGPAQGGFVELTFPQPGHYPFVSHSMVDAERGAHGVIEVTR